MFAVLENLFMVAFAFSFNFVVQIANCFGNQLSPTGDVKCVYKQQCVGDMRI